MDRRKALALAGTVAITLTAAGTAAAANLGILRAGTATGPVGQLNAENVASLTDTVPPTTVAAPTTTAPVEVIEEVVTVPAEPAPTAAPRAERRHEEEAGEAEHEAEEHGGVPPTVAPSRVPAGASPTVTTAPAPTTEVTPSTAPTGADGHDGWDGHDDEEHELDD